METHGTVNTSLMHVRFTDIRTGRCKQFQNVKHNAINCVCFNEWKTKTIQSTSPEAMNHKPAHN